MFASLGRGAIRAGLVALAYVGAIGNASANNVAENAAWQLPTSSDKVNRAYLERLRLEQNAKSFGPPVYNTVIQRQYNCSVASNALGTTSTSNLTGLTSSASGHNSNALGNSDTNAINASSGGGSYSLNGSQNNQAPINSDIAGNMTVGMQGNPSQVLNNEQSNTGSQSASIDGSSACSFTGGN